ncbi:hypothetical protein F5X98DRAFT_110976 [Xylaria grammica]|nr:hypothetical protein F5X98DRAFT_110976 [Xylaria grammica]
MTQSPRLTPPSSAASPANPQPSSYPAETEYYIADPTTKRFPEPTVKQFTKPKPKQFTKPTSTYPVTPGSKYVITSTSTSTTTTKSTSTPAPAPAPTTYPHTPLDPPLPGSCYTTTSDPTHHRVSVQTHSCYTQTSFFAAAPCPTLSCKPPPTDLICPQYIKVSSLTVPCATNCCPTTTTVYEPDYAAPCPTCDPCRIPTEWITYTTGCPGTPTITDIHYVTPAYPVAYPV